MITKCHICNSVVNEDGTVDNCMGECGREFNMDYSPTKELDFNQDSIPALMVSDVYDEDSNYDEIFEADNYPPLDDDIEAFLAEEGE